jgi:hypothetical protein
MLAFGQITMLVFITYTEAVTCGIAAWHDHTRGINTFSRRGPPAVDRPGHRQLPANTASGGLGEDPGNLLGQLVNRAVDVR